MDNLSRTEILVDVSRVDDTIRDILRYIIHIQVYNYYERVCVII